MKDEGKLICLWNLIVILRINVLLFVLIMQYLVICRSRTIHVQKELIIFINGMEFFLTRFVQRQEINITF